MYLLIDGSIWIQIQIGIRIRFQKLPDPKHFSQVSVPERLNMESNGIWIRITLTRSGFDLSPWCGSWFWFFLFDADPDPHQLKIDSHSIHFGDLDFHFMRIRMRIQVTKMMRIHADPYAPDPQNCSKPLPSNKSKASTGTCHSRKYRLMEVGSQYRCDS
jgi:hypothetical protein